MTTKIFSDFRCNVEIDDNYHIIPGILSTFVENAFKHGILNDKENPITVSLDIKNDVLTFIVRNKKANKKIKISTGIGLSNVNQVLKIYYPNNHNLIIDQDDITYCSKLNLKLTTTL
ncbi:MAG TPA: hypothetical protein VFM99_04755 [Chitinophagales bacterium]|nr:hypothetical protein [Chitinophagales bacterium]